MLLFIEQDKVWEKIIREYFEKLEEPNSIIPHWSAATAGAGYEPPQVVIIDIAPFAGHSEIPGQIRRAFFSPSLPIVVYTSLTHPALVVNCLNNGYNHFIDKKFARPEILREEISKFILQN